MYDLLFYFALFEDGTGDSVLAEYRTITKRVLKSPAHVVPVDQNEREKNRVTFTISKDKSIQEYLGDQFAQQGITHCITMNSYEIVE